MPITPSTTKDIWIMTTGLLAAGVLTGAVADLFMSFRPGSADGPLFYALVSALSLMVRLRLRFSASRWLVSAAGISSAGIAAYALADILSPGANAELIDASGPYLLLGTWLLGLDTIYREIETSRLRNTPEITAGE